MNLLHQDLLWLEKDQRLKKGGGSEAGLENSDRKTGSYRRGKGEEEKQCVLHLLGMIFAIRSAQSRAETQGKATYGKWTGKNWFLRVRTSTTKLSRSHNNPVGRGAERGRSLSRGDSSSIHKRSKRPGNRTKESTKSSEKRREPPPRRSRREGNIARVRLSLSQRIKRSLKRGEGKKKRTNPKEPAGQGEGVKEEKGGTKRDEREKE